MSESGWVAIGTLALAFATVWLAVETRSTRRDAERADTKVLLIAALADQLDNCRALVAHDPARGVGAYKGLRDAGPDVGSLGTLLRSVDLPADLAAYLIWLRREITDWHMTMANGMATPLVSYGGEPAPSPSAEQANGVRNAWWVLLDRCQVTAALLAGEAKRRGMMTVAALQDGNPWTVVRQGGPTERVPMAANDRAVRNAPAFPADPAFAFASPSSRDKEGHATGERQSSALLRRDGL